MVPQQGPNWIMQQTEKQTTHPVNSMAYGSSTRTADVPHLYRVERGYPYLRHGKLVQAIPQWKSLTLYSVTTANAPTSAFNTTTTPKSISYPTRILS